MSYDANSAVPSMPAASNAGAADLSQPLYGASFAQAIKRFFKKYATFTGRASRAEFWWSYLFLALLQLVPGILMSIGGAMLATATASMGAIDPYDPNAATAAAEAVSSGPGVILMTIGGILSGIIFLATIVPTIAVSWRRLHDANFPGPFFLLHLIPSLGTIIVLVLMLMPTKPEGQRFDR